MALFPAYAYLANKDQENTEESAFDEPDNYPDEATETQLLISDENSEDEKTNKDQFEPAKALSSPDIIPTSTNFYIDSNLDYGNLRVSTLYYPGRPQYEYYGLGKQTVGESVKKKESRKRRYYSKRIPDEPEAPAVAERTEAYRLLIAQSPDDVLLWERYIDFQEACGGEEAALRAAEEAAERVPAARLRRRRLAALRRALPPHRYLERLRDMLAAEKCAETRTCLWEHLVEALAAAPECGVAGAAAAAAAGLRGGGGAPALLHAAGAALRAAGHWERLVLLLDLLVAMNYAPAALALPDAALQARADRRLADLEDKAVASGLPLSAVWVRVERARAAAHWAPAPAAGALGAGADPQRAPLAHDVAELLQPVAGAELARLSPRLLALAQVPALPGAQWAARALGGARADSAAEALLPLLEAARALPPAHPAAAAADPELARRVLALLLDPPHYFSDDNGYLSFVNSLWDACSARAGGEAAAALLCWRLRWLRALLALAPRDAPGRREAARLRAGARALLRPGSAPLAFAEFARVEREAAGAARARHVAAQALRAALADPDCPQHHTMYIARIVCEVSWDGGPQESAAGACALVCAVLGRAPPAELAAPSPADLAAALDKCEERCAALERELAAGGGQAGGGGEAGVEALLPGASEWARARAALAPPPRREQLLRDAGAAAAAACGVAAARYWEESAEALCGARGVRGGGGGGVRAAQWARVFAPLFPANAYLALASAGAPLWALRAPGAAGAGRAGGAGGAGGGDVRALAALLPPLLRALRSDFAPPEAEALARAARRATRAGAGALLWAARLEAEARAPAPRDALYAALDAAPAHKWLYVRGAAWRGGEAAALADALLERALRLHALPDELAPPADGVQ